jgi:ABC-type multidrug transport system fused ATPase/permease subunit
MKLIPRLYEIGSGRIRIDGTDIRRMQPDDLRRRIASVPQHTHLFSLSIRDNIACGRIDATVEEITEAAKKANAHDFIMGMEHGYDTILGENGSNLSGGQKQRIAIARAFVRNPDILLLDEATASLDSESERSVLDALHTLMKGRTTLISAHRRTTIERADRVIVMENARVSAVGTHLDLANSSPAYIRLMNMPVTALVSGQL